VLFDENLDVAYRYFAERSLPAQWVHKTASRSHFARQRSGWHAVSTSTSVGSRT
jgi:hypothetical protein